MERRLAIVERTIAELDPLARTILIRSRFQGFQGHSHALIARDLGIARPVQAPPARVGRLRAGVQG
ncbi:MAG: hypothetical protein ACREV3_09485 [Gammaproteobacteria bacterium]